MTRLSHRAEYLVAAYLGTSEGAGIAPAMGDALIAFLSHTRIGRRIGSVEQVHMVRQAIDDIVAIRARHAVMGAQKSPLRARRQGRKVVGA